MMEGRQEAHRGDLGMVEKTRRSVKLLAVPLHGHRDVSGRPRRRANLSAKSNSVFQSLDHVLVISLFFSPGGCPSGPADCPSASIHGHLPRAGGFPATGEAAGELIAQMDAHEERTSAAFEWAPGQESSYC
jgi:hypothetical protein